MVCRLRVFALALSVVVLAATPAAGSPADNAQRRAEAARKLDLLKASDAQLLAASAALDTALSDAVRKAGSARRASEDADAAAVIAEKKLKSVEQVVADRAVAAYTATGPTPGAPDLTGANPNDNIRRLELERFVDARLTDAVDSLRASRADLAQKRSVAKSKAKAATTALADVAKARDYSHKARAEVDSRIAEAQGELAAIDAEQAAVSQIISSRPSTAAFPTAPGPGTGPLGFAWPLTAGRTTSEFGPRWGRMHQGLDIAAPEGTPILASRAGVVIFAGWRGGYGNYTLIDHGGGYVTGYGHQVRLGTTVGATVQRGQVFGFVGSTGHSTGPHVHFEVRVNGVPENPRLFLPAR